MPETHPDDTGGPQQRSHDRHRGGEPEEDRVRPQQALALRQLALEIGKALREAIVLSHKNLNKKIYNFFTFLRMDILKKGGKLLKEPDPNQ